MSVAIHGDHLVVGADGDTDIYTNPRYPGTVYAYTRYEEEWRPRAMLRASIPAPQTGDRFGQVVSLDDETITVGSPNADGLGYWAGAAYVFSAWGGDLNRDGATDIFCVLNAFLGSEADECASPERADIAGPAGCAPDGRVDIFDILAVLDAFADGPSGG